MLQMGKLRVHKSGKVKLHLGDVAFDMTRGIACEVCMKQLRERFHRAVGSLPAPLPAHARGLSMYSRTSFPRQEGPLRKLTGTLCAPGAGRRYHCQCCWEGRRQRAAPGGGQQAHRLHARHEVAAASEVGFAAVLHAFRSLEVQVAQCNKGRVPKLLFNQVTDVCHSSTHCCNSAVLQFCSTQLSATAVSLTAGI